MKFHKGTTPQNGIVYFIATQSGGSIICKIGFTGGNVWERIRQIQACSPLELDLFGYFGGTLRLERRFHETFAPVRLHGEWFHADGKLYDFIWRLSECGGNRRLTTSDEMLIAVSDIILADNPIRSSVDKARWAESAREDAWEEIFA